MKKTILNIVFIIYVVVAVFATICLLSYNDFKVTEFGDYSLVLVTDDSIEPDYNAGDLVITKKNRNIAVDEKVFFYNTFEKNIEVKLAKITDSERVTSSEITYTLDGGHKISSQYVLGPSSTTTVIPKAGSVLSVLESRWGFLFIIVLPALIAFIYQITVIFTEIKNPKDDSNEKK